MNYPSPCLNCEKTVCAEKRCPEWLVRYLYRQKQINAYAKYGRPQKLEKRPHRFDRLREDNPKEWEFWMYRCVTDPETGEKFGWGRVLDYIGIEWEGLPGALPGQIVMEDLLL